MSTIAVVFDVPDFTHKNYDDILVELKKTGEWPPETGLLSHVSFQRGDNWCVVDVWTSQEEFMNFGQSRLFPIFEKLGLAPQPPQIYPVHLFIKTGGVQEVMSA
jgi:hypothetical protein